MCVYYSFYNPTLLTRESVSDCGLQTSRFADEGSEKHSGAYPPASCGFYALYERQGGFFMFFDFKLLFTQKLFLKVIVLKKSVLLFGIIPLLLCGCDNYKNNKSQSRDIFAMDTYMNIGVYGESADIALNSAEEEIHRLEKLLSVTDENSQVCILNSADGKTISVSDDVKQLLEFSLEAGKKTSGCLDVSVYPLLRLWGFTTDVNKIPTQAEIDEALKCVDYSQIEISGNDVTLPKNLEIDFGAVAKGYTSDKIAEILKENGAASGIINLGGNVCAIGEKPDGSMWKVAVTNPFSPDETLGAVEVSDKAVVTSGNYQRYFIGENGESYCHIINPFTGFPVDNGLCSVTVIGESGLMCDALSTALFVMGKEQAVEFMNTQPKMSYILVEENGNVTISENITPYFKLTADLPMEIIQNEN